MKKFYIRLFKHRSYYKNLSNQALYDKLLDHIKKVINSSDKYNEYFDQIDEDNSDGKSKYIFYLNFSKLLFRKLVYISFNNTKRFVVFKIILVRLLSQFYRIND